MIGDHWLGAVPQGLRRMPGACLDLAVCASIGAASVSLPCDTVFSWRFAVVGGSDDGRLRTEDWASSSAG
jgi:hypothetical protein